MRRTYLRLTNREWVGLTLEELWLDIKLFFLTGVIYEGTR